MAKVVRAFPPEVPKPTRPDVPALAKGLEETLVRIEQMGKIDSQSHEAYMTLVRQAVDLASRIHKDTAAYVHALTSHHQTRR